MFINRIRIGSIVLICLALGIAPRSVSAHFLSTDHAIGAVLHITPEDDPVANEQTGFFFELKDTTGKFTPAACECSFTVSDAGKELYSTPIFQAADPTPTSVNAFYTFPTRDVYQVKLIGKPTSPGAFQPFTLKWDIRVARMTVGTQQDTLVDWFKTHVVHVLGIGIILVFFIITVIADQRKRLIQKGK